MIHSFQPKKPFLTAQWQHIVMLNFEVAPEILQPYVPLDMEIDLWEGKAFVTLVGLNFVTEKVFGMHLPLLPSFDQVNLRFYVRFPLNRKEQRGVAFIKEIVPRFVVSAVARLLFKQNYSTTSVSHQVKPASVDKEPEEMIEYSWGHDKKWQKMSVHGHGDFKFPAKGSKEEFVVERYRGYTKKGPVTIEFRVAHSPWRIQLAKDATIECEVGKIFGPEFEPFIQKNPTFTFLAEGGAASLFYPHRIT